MEAPKPPNIAGMILIGKSFVIKGQVSCDGDLYIEGQVEGSVDPKGNRLTIGPDGRLKANVTARTVVVHGKLEGNIQASERVDLKQSAVVVGDIVTQSITIESGAHIKGSIEVHGGTATDKSASAAASSPK
ncbi:MAG TPA: polymer-forming cytoskeletal protein [Candidatus Sulfotelmatobacter sp.]|nr:polymer-forming cytoskeletal protein [Candidatus Sulfotelmatobacter sp.]